MEAHSPPQKAVETPQCTDDGCSLICWGRHNPITYPFSKKENVKFCIFPPPKKKNMVVLLEGTGIFWESLELFDVPVLIMEPGNRPVPDV